MELVQYILLRGDLRGFSQGAIIAQACHSSVYSIEKFRENEATAEYLRDITAMKKVILRIKEEDIEEIMERLNLHALDYTAWREQPENIVTCISLRPYKRDDLREVREFLGRFRLY
jgi:peptidyl-tRNA hydrolase